MLLFKWIENISCGDVINIRNENGEVVFSIRLPSGNIRSFTYSEITHALEDQRIYESRKNLATDQLTHFYELDKDVRLQIYGYIELSDDKIAELNYTISECQLDIIKYRRLDNMFDQLVEHFKAGLISSGIEYQNRNGHTRDIKSVILKEIDLYTAGRDVAKQYRRTGNKKQLIELCRNYLNNHKIKGKPDYTSEDLSNYVSHIPPG